MPEFKSAAAETIALRRRLDPFTAAYVMALYFTETDGDDQPSSDTTMSVPSIVRCQVDCENFQRDNAALLAEAYQQPGYGPTSAGHDFWLTRNGHGAGFWDRGLGDVGERLSEAARDFGECYVHENERGRLELT